MYNHRQAPADQKERIDLIQVKNYTKQYGDHIVVNDISFTAKDGAESLTELN